jgi:hypothetical protein
MPQPSSCASAHAEAEYFFRDLTMQTTVGTPTLSAILCFLLIVALTLAVT